ncbi:hypothetical protein ACFLT9_14575 [Acidobacteriota bacterium]
MEFPDFWFHVRPSNTEPVVRFLVEARTEGLARKTMALIKDEIL